MSQPTRTDEMTRVLREEVLRGQYRAGERLPSERELAARFETTRGVARVALKKLEQMGLANVLPGGARVQPLREASLDVIGPLLELQDPPDPELVDQILEVGGALIAATLRMTLERAEPGALEPARRLIDRLRETDVSMEEGHEIMRAFADAVMGANPNVVMHMLRRVLHTELFDSLDALRTRLESVDPRTGERAAVPPRQIEMKPYADEIARALERLDGRAASEALHEMWQAFRGSVRESLEATRERKHLERTGSLARSAP